MLLHKKGILRLALCLPIIALTQPAPAETLREVIARTVHSNPDIQVTTKVRSASNEEVHQARAGYFPSLDLTAGFARERGENVNTAFEENTLWRRNYGIEARQMLFDGFATKNEVQRTKAKTNADAFKVWGTAEDVSLSAVQAYLDVLRNRELLALARRNLSSHQRTYSMVRRLSEQGVGREADTEQTLGRLDLARANLVTAGNNFQDAEVTFLRITGMRAKHLAPPPDVPRAWLPTSKEDAILRALRKHPILQSANVDILEARGQYRASKSRFYPRIDFVIRADEARNAGGVRGPNRVIFAGLELQYNILQGGRDLARTRQTAYQVEEACEIRNRTFREVVETMELSWIAYRNASQRLPLLRARRNAASLTANAYHKQFDLGKRTILDVLDSQNEYYTSQIDIVNERYALLLAKYRMLNGMGKLIKFFHIPLPYEAYVPYRKVEILG